MTEDLFSVAILAGFITAIIYLIFKRIEDKKNEDFEDRDN